MSKHRQSHRVAAVFDKYFVNMLEAGIYASLTLSNGVK
jgi:hypothetical protein